MPLVECPDCKKLISDLAESCVNCGRPMSAGKNPEANDRHYVPLKKGRKRTKALPTSIILVSLLFFTSGLVGAIEMANSIIANHFTFNLWSIGVLIGPGLLMRSQAWRTVAIIYIYFFLFWLALGTLAFVFTQGSIGMKFPGVTFNQASFIQGLFALGFIFFLYLWQYNVLNRPEIMKLFGLNEDD